MTTYSRKTDVRAANLRERFGYRITDLVCAVSDDERIAGHASPKAALRQRVANAGVEALRVLSADKVSKLRELRRETADHARADASSGRVHEPPARRMEHYRGSPLLEQRLPDRPLVRELRDELATLVSHSPIHAGAS